MYLVPKFICDRDSAALLSAGKLWARWSHLGTQLDSSHATGTGALWSNPMDSLATVQSKAIQAHDESERLASKAYRGVGYTLAHTKPAETTSHERRYRGIAYHV